MATSPNFNWPEPDNTDLVKNGALAMRTLGNAIDASMADLKGGTTGQVLSKASNTDMDFTWVAQDDSNAIQNSIVDAKGDIIVATANDTPARLGVGTNGQVLKANSATATGLEWAADTAGMTNPMTTTGDTIYSSSGSTPARLGIGSSGQVLTVSGGVPTWASPAGGGGMTLLSTTTLSGTSTAISSISGSYTNLLVLVYGITGSTGGELRLNGATTGVYATKTFTEAGNFYSGVVNNGMTRWNEGGAVSGNISVALLINNYASTASTKVVKNTGGFMNSTTGYSFNQYGFYNSTSAITSLTVTSDGASFTAGTVLIYGVK